MTRPGKVRTRCRSDPGSERVEMLPTIAMGIPPVTNLVLDDRRRSNVSLGPRWPVRALSLRALYSPDLRSPRTRELARA